jgi:imidazoleglycerol-phosphate dehydratase
MRNFEVKRKTAETDIELTLNLDGSGKSNIDTGIGFMDHMLTLFARHGGFDLDVKCVGDTYVDYHHSVEDIGIALGTAFAGALGDKKGINRYGSVILPMDEALVISAIDISGRCHLTFDAEIPTQKVGDFDTELVKEFFEGFVRNFPIALHVKKLSGENSHHIIEAVFKAAARALREALAIDPTFPDAVPSTKGGL